jgi:hypothetical protein
MKNNRYLPIEADEDLPTGEINGERKSIKLFDTNVWKESPELQNGVVLTSYIEQLYNEGHTPDQIAAMVNLPIKTIKKKLNTIVNSFLGTPTSESKDLRRIEVDDQIMRQIEDLKEVMEELRLEGKATDIQKITKYSAQISKLLEIRMKLWGLDDEKPASRESKQTGIVGRVISRIDDKTKSKIADFMIGLTEKE